MSINVKEEVLTKLSYKEILKILPHRFPFLFVDKIIEVNLEEKYIIGQKNTCLNEQYFQGHFPEKPIMPGVLVLEALAQTGGIYCHLKGYSDKLCALLRIDKAKFRHPVFPGDVLTLRANEIYLGSKGGKFQGEARIGDKLVAEAEISCVLLEKDTI
ncbi:MAG: 3-hydroxyacyl-[acyl-carrier-protein] dehydratase FabZ [Chlamydiae bacterium]|nr:3-hydroxyacyl-[acyl-carrier-protein] dehydratase FabZ [Chlamydiota bacterium]